MEYQKDYRSGSTYTQEGTQVNSVQMTTAAAYRHMYGWMTAALCLTGVAAYLTSDLMFRNEAVLMGLIQFRWILLIATFGLVMWISAGIQRMSFSTATVLFALYSVVMGVSLAPIFLVYTMASVAKVFFITAGTFGSMALIGHVTKADLSKVGQICFMGLIGIIIASIVNWFFHSPMLDYIVSGVGVLIFCGLTMWDVQKMKDIIYSYGDMADEQISKIALLGALSLYLDFINLFLYLLRFFGSRRD